MFVFTYFQLWLNYATLYQNWRNALLIYKLYTQRTAPGRMQTYLSRF